MPQSVDRPCDTKVSDPLHLTLVVVIGGGDTKRGASLIVWAIAEGRKMAAGINQYLQAGKSAKQSVK